MEKNSLLNLFLTFFKIGAFTFGGGYAMIPLIEREACEKNKWIDEEEILDILAIAESTPGVLAVNMATFTGHKVRGFIGSLIATLGVVLPSFFVIILISILFSNINDNVYVIKAFSGIKAGIIVLILGAGKKLCKHIKMDTFNITMILFSFIFAIFTNIDIIYLLITAAIIGLVYNYFINIKKIGE